MKERSFARIGRLALIGMLAIIAFLIVAGEPVVQAQGGSPCVTCHTKVTPGIIT